MTIDTDGLEFDSLDNFAWKQFLATRAGLRLLPKVAESAPQLLGQGDTNALLTRAGELRGFQLALQTLLSLAAPPPPPAKKEPIAWPDLHDDEAHADGQHLTQNK